MTDQIQRFIFEEADVRGELVRLEQSYSEVLTKSDYPLAVAQLIGDFLSAAALLSETIKFDGTLILQARSEGDLSLIMAEATSNGHLRAIAKYEDDKEGTSKVSKDFQTLLKDGQLSITIDPAKGNRYQGIVPLDGYNLAECLEHYFSQSEQLSTRIWLSSNGQTAAGMLLQELPASDISDASRQQQWEHVTHLAATLKDEELLSLDFEALLHRLYHQDPVRLFDASPLIFQCSCSEQRTMNAIRAIGRKEAEEILTESGEITIQCEFCHHDYRFANEHLDKIFEASIH